MKIEALEFLEAIQALAERAGIELPVHNPATEKPMSDKKKLMYEAHELVAKLFHYVLLEKEAGQEGKEYLLQRGFNEQTLSEFQLGFAPDSWDFVTGFLEKRGFPLSLMKEAGLISLREVGKRYFDRFRNRVIFPIWDGQGRVVGFGGRMMGEGTPKYLNSPETNLFNKGRLLFNFHRARKSIRKQQEVILFEGYVDVISAWQQGVTNGIATLGTALTEEQARIIRRNADQVVLCYDSDRAGIEAAMKGAALLTEAGCRVKVAHMPDKMDPDDYIQRYGGDKFRQDVILSARTLTAFRLEYLKIGKKLNDEAERMKYIHDALYEITKLSSAVERDHYLRQLSEEFQLSFDALKQEQWKVYRKQKKGGARDNWVSKWNNNKNNGNPFVAKPLMPAHHNAERRLISWMMRDEAIARQIEEEVGGLFHVDEYAALAAHLYKFYQEGNPPDTGKFIHQLQDDKLIQTASELAMTDVNQEVSEKELFDCIRQVLNYNKKRQINELNQELKKMERSGNIEEAARIGQEIQNLRKQLKQV